MFAQKGDRREVVVGLSFWATPMLNAKISALDLVVMVVYLVAIVGWGLFHSKRKNAEQKLATHCWQSISK